VIKEELTCLLEVAAAGSPYLSKLSTTDMANGGVGSGIPTLDQDSTAGKDSMISALTRVQQLLHPLWTSPAVS
jgi:hypothetical protein